MFLIGLIAALVASLLFNVGIVLQALDARSAPRSLSLRLGLVWRLVHQPRWVAGFVLGIVGIGPQLLAYADAPFVVVQPALATGLLLLLVLGRRTLGEEIDWPELVGMPLIVAGIALVSWGAPAHVETHRGAIWLVSVAAGLSLVGVLPFLVRGTRLDAAMLTIVASGCGFGMTNIATKLMSDDIPNHWPQAAAWGVAGLGMGLAATVTGMTAFQRARATVVVPVTTAVQTFVPIVLEPLFLREHWASAEYDGAPIVAGLVVAFVGSMLVSRSRAVSGMVASAQ